MEIAPPHGLTLTTGLALAGTQVAFLGTGIEDPNGLSELLDDQLPPSGVFTDLTADLSGPGALPATIPPTNAARAGELLAETSRTHDTIVLGASFQLRHRTPSDVQLDGAVQVAVRNSGATASQHRASFSMQAASSSRNSASSAYSVSEMIP
ncbi:hypothetical protein ACH4VR_36350 [Streptomyces sp. NPDC020883]|uniref:hypothetical protein n=1 Tax=Streptomyces sp. NPDC020883 TaxID=3365099 RepID=UPI00379DB52D